jgi:hypothetical protein
MYCICNHYYNRPDDSCGNAIGGNRHNENANNYDQERKLTNSKEEQLYCCSICKLDKAKDDIPQLSSHNCNVVVCIECLKKSIYQHLIINGESIEMK